MWLVFVSLGWLFGIAAVAAWDSPWWFAGVTLLLILPASGSGLLPIRYGLILAVAAAALVGGVRFAEWENQPPIPLSMYLGQELDITGQVSSVPEPRLTTSQFRVDVESANSMSTQGAVLVTASQYADWVPGDRVRLKGKLDEAPVFDTFDYRGYLARQGIAGTMFFPDIAWLGSERTLERHITTVRLELERAMERALPEPEASLATGITLGRDSTIPRDLYDDYRRSGLAHIIAVSGANVAILAGFIFVVATPLVGVRFAAIPAGVMVACYVLLAGASETVVRAGIMSGILLVALWMGRQQSGLSALGAAAIIMTAVKPSLAASVGFQLSLAATAAIIVFTPWLHYWTFRLLGFAGMERLVPRWLQLVFALTLAAWIGTLPLLWGTFGEVSIVSPVSNLVVEPVFAFAFVLSLIAGFAGWLYEPAGWFAGLLAYYPLALCNETARTFGSLPFASVSVPRLGATTILAMYALLCVPAWYCYRYLAPEVEVPPLRRLELRRQRLLASAAAGCCVAIAGVHSLLPLNSSEDLRVTMLDVGQGDALLIETPGGQQILVDGGPSGIGLARELGEVLPHWDRRIDAVVLTHLDQDHAGGFPELFERFAVGTVYDNGRNRNTEVAQLYAALASERQALAAGDAVELDDGVRIDVLWPPPGHGTSDENERSLVLLVRYGQTSFLLTGDIERQSQLALLPGLPTVSVLKVPHHGAGTSDPRFLEATGAALALVSVGEGNRFGHPAQATLDGLAGMIVLRTDLDGRITIRSDGKRLEYSTER
jgi:competence protein ComEC